MQSTAEDKSYLPPRDPLAHANAKAGVSPKAGIAEKEKGFLQSPSGLFKRRSYLSRDVRRDSGMASSVSTAGDRPETGGNPAPKGVGDAPPQLPVIPTILVQDETRGLSSSQNQSSDFSDKNEAVSDTLGGQSPTPSSGAESFSALTTDIPTGNFEDPFPTQIQFSNRGSVLLAGPEAGTFERALQMSGDILGTSNASEEQRLSRRVRSFYEPQKGLATEQEGVNHAISKMDAVKDEEADEVPELASGLPVQHRQGNDRLRGSGNATAYSAPSFECREPYEAAGGNEDWTDVDSRDVDRWGFINLRSSSSKRSSIASTSAPRSPEPHRGTRPGTGLTVMEEQQLGAQNGNAKKPTNRLSLNPGGRTLRSSPSLLSSRSKRSNASRMIPYRNSNSGPRWLIDAPDMLSTPPGLGNQSSDPHLDPVREAKRADKWQKMAKPISNSQSSRGGGTKYVFNTSDPKLISRVWKGIPDRWRSEAWYAFLTTSAARNSANKRTQPTDEELENFFHSCQHEDCADDVQIDMDVPRTIGNHLQFRKRYRGGQRFLFRVLRALSLYFPATGYVQGMASVVATLLVYYEESRAFVMAARLWQLRGIRKLYAEGFEGLMDALRELEERWIQRSEVLKQLEELGISTSAWGPKWYLTIFNYVLPFHTMLRVWDVFMLLGDPPLLPSVASAAEGNGQANFDALHAASAAMLFALRDTIVGADFENAMKALTSPVGVEKDDKMMGIARRLWEEKRGKRRV